MEAKALHDFNASSQDELSFQKGSIVKVRAFTGPRPRHGSRRATARHGTIRRARQRLQPSAHA